MNGYNPATVFSSIDTNGRYAFGNQPLIARWNLSAFASALLPLISENKNKAIELAQKVLEDFQPLYTEKWYSMMLRKLGIQHPEESDKELVDRLLALMETHKADYTHTFLALQQDKELDQSLFKSAEFRNWKKDWSQTHLRHEDKSPDHDLMKSMNPNVIPRNHWVENALDAAVDANLSPFQELLSTLTKPYDGHPDEIMFQKVPEDFDARYQTFCGT